jgi:3-oxoacyl-[acyl-carrier-protein] synthase II
VTPVVITGASVVTPFADDPRALHDVLCAGGCGPGHVTTFTTAGLPCDLGGVIDPAVLRHAVSDRPSPTIDKIGLLAVLGSRRALAAAAFADGPPADLGVVLGTMFSGAHTIGEFDRRAQTAGPGLASPLDFANTVLNAAAGQAAIRLSLRGLNTTISGGHTSGLQAVGYGSELVGSGRAPALLAGGAEELAVESYLGFCRAGLMCGTNGRPGHVPVPFDARRTGCALGEGAGFVLMESASAAAERGARVRGEIAAFWSETDPDAFTRGFCGSATIASSIRAALDRAGVRPQEIDAVSAAANGSYTGDSEESDALGDVFGARVPPPAVTAIKSVLGETLGASGPLQVIAMCEAMNDSRLPGIRGFRDSGGSRISAALSSTVRALPIRTALVLATSPEGSCCALVLRAPGGHQ